jgi:integrase
MSTVSPIGLQEFRARVLALYTPPLRRKATHRKMGLILAYLARVPGVATTADLTTDAMARYAAMRSPEVGRNTIIGELGYLKAATAYADEAGLIDRPPSWRRLRMKRGPGREKKHHPIADLVKVLSHLEANAGDWPGRRLYTLASTVAHTGLRRNEALRMRVEDVSLAERVLWVVARGEDGLKTAGSEAPVPIPGPLAAALASWLPIVDSPWLFPCLTRGGPWTGGTAEKCALGQLREAGRAVGVEGLTWQSLRHSWATHAESAWGLPEGVIQRVLRHTTRQTQRHYRHADLANLSEAVAAVSYSG